VEGGANVQAYDPVAMDKMKSFFPNITYCNDVYHASKGADAVLLVTEWDQIKKMNLKKLKSKMSTPLLIDGRNVFEPEAMAKLGFRYISVGRPRPS
jgi:UDPglucose 6-dehydrogenase